jgi:DNA topoisomerase VI subunit B
VATNWKGYGLGQSKGALPAGPAVIVVHVASVWVPFTSESKEAVAHYPEIIKEIRLGLQEVGRQLGTHVNRRARQHDELKKRSYIETYMPAIAEALSDILGLQEPQRKTVLSRLRIVLEKTRSVKVDDERIIGIGERKTTHVGTWKEEEDEVPQSARGKKKAAEPPAPAAPDADTKE